MNEIEKSWSRLFPMRLGSPVSRGHSIPVVTDIVVDPHQELMAEELPVPRFEYTESGVFQIVKNLETGKLKRKKIQGPGRHFKMAYISRGKD